MGGGHVGFFFLLVDGLDQAKMEKKKTRKSNTEAVWATTHYAVSTGHHDSGQEAVERRGPTNQTGEERQTPTTKPRQ